jgi:hypothetical protein
MTIEDKLKAVQTSPQLLNATMLLIAAFQDCELKSHIRFIYTVNDAKYEITFLPIINEVTYKVEEEVKQEIIKL